MGYYIQVPGNHNKAAQLVQLFNAEIVPKPHAFADVPEDKALICIIDNGMFEAAGLCYSEAEFECFADPDERPHWWVLMNKDQAHKLTGFTENNGE